MVIDYSTQSGQRFTDDAVKEVVYHECSHASHYAYAGSGLYSTFVNYELDEMANYRTSSYFPYGKGVSSYSHLIALGEGWAFHMGYFLANQKYIVEPGPNNPKGDPSIFVQYQNYNTGTDGVSLENFIVKYLPDPFTWIPKGLMWDMMDSGEPNFTLVTDNVSGYTIQQIFAALQSDVTDFTIYKARILQQNPNNPTNSQINALFHSYNY